MAMPGRKKIKNPASSSFSFPVNLVIEINKLTNWTKIGEGGCGEVFRVDHEDWGPLAIKKLGVSMMDDGLAITSKLKEEACVLYDLRHKNIVLFTGVLWSPPEFGIAMPFVPHGSLSSFIATYEAGWLAKVDFMQQIALGLNYLHTLTNPVVHGDLKLANVLVDDGCIMKLSDFGLSSWRTYQTTYSKTKSNVSGTITHIAPETWSGDSLVPNQNQDVYAFAILCWELFSEKVPFEGCRAEVITQLVVSGKRPHISDMGDDLPQGIKDVIKRCWSQRPEDRPSMLDIKNEMESISSPLKKNILKAKTQLLAVLNDDSDEEKALAGGMQNTSLKSNSTVRFSFKLVGTLDLFQHDVAGVAYGSNGECLVTANNNSKYAEMYTLTNGTYKLAWKKKLPNGLLSNSKMFITPTEIYARTVDPDINTCSTFVFDHKFQLKRKYLPTSNERLTGVTDEYLIYEKMGGNQLCARAIGSHKEILGAFRRRVDHPIVGNDSALYVTTDISSDKIVVTSSSEEKNDRWISIYKSLDCELHHRTLPFDPGRAIFLLKYIFVPHLMESKMGIFNWSCDNVCTLSHKELHLDEDDELMKCSNMYGDNLVSMLVETSSGHSKINVLKICC